MTSAARNWPTLCQSSGQYSRSAFLGVKYINPKFFGESESVSVDVKRLSGAWAGYYRVRSGRIRIIFSFDAEELRAFVEVVDYRGDVYK